MQFAKCDSDGKVWEAAKFALLNPEILDVYRQNLYCAECASFAWFRRESRNGHPAHFCAHHIESCSFKLEYVATDNTRGLPTTDEDSVDAGNSLIVDLDEDLTGNIHVAPQETSSKPGSSGGGGRAYIGPNGNKESSQRFTLRKILHRLVQSPQFRNSSIPLKFSRREGDVLISGYVKDVIKSFSQVNTGSFYSNTGRFYWGAIASARISNDGRLWLNSGENNLVSVVLFEDIVQAFLKQFQIDDLEELAGAHVLVYGKCQEAATGKPMIWCGSTKYILVRKYRDA